jgi:hypothetical protein
LRWAVAPEKRKRIYSWIIDTLMMGPTSRPVTLVNNQTTQRQHPKIQHNSEYKTPKTHLVMIIRLGVYRSALKAVLNCCSHWLWISTVCLWIVQAVDSGSGPFHNDCWRNRMGSEVKIECYNSSHITANARQAVADSYLFSLALRYVRKLLQKQDDNWTPVQWKSITAYSTLAAESRLYPSRDLRSSLMLRSLDWLVVTDVSGILIGPIFPVFWRLVNLLPYQM